MAIFFTSCGNDDDNNDCEDRINANLNAANDYTLNPSAENCIAYKGTLQALLDTGCTSGSAAGIQTTIDLLGSCN